MLSSSRSPLRCSTRNFRVFPDTPVENLCFCECHFIHHCAICKVILHKCFKILICKADFIHQVCTASYLLIKLLCRTLSSTHFWQLSGTPSEPARNLTAWTLWEPFLLFVLLKPLLPHGGHMLYWILSQVGLKLLFWTCPTPIYHLLVSLLTSAFLNFVNLHFLLLS